MNFPALIFYSHFMLTIFCILFQDQVLYKKALSSYILRDHIQSIERAIAANLGLLPDSDLWKQLFSGAFICSVPASIKKKIIL